MTKTTSSSATLNNLSALANLTPEPKLQASLLTGVTSTLEYAKILQTVPTDNVTETSDITGLTNVLRDDVVTPSLSQDEALSNAPTTHQGYFMVNAVFDNES